MLKLFLGIDSATRFIGANKLIKQLEKLAGSHKAEIIYTGGYGLYYLEPLVEIEFKQEKYAFSQLKKRISQAY